jgi:hypothetical protein
MYDFKSTIWILLSLILTLSCATKSGVKTEYDPIRFSEKKFEIKDAHGYDVTVESIEKAHKAGNIVRGNLCSLNNAGIRCVSYIEIPDTKIHLIRSMISGDNGWSFENIRTKLAAQTQYKQSISGRTLEHTLSREICLRPESEGKELKLITVECYGE